MNLDNTRRSDNVIDVRNVPTTILTSVDDVLAAQQLAAEDARHRHALFTRVILVGVALYVGWRFLR